MVLGAMMKAIFSFFLLLLTGFFIGGITIHDSIIGNSVLKIIDAICLFGFWKTFPKNNNLY